MVVLLVGKLSFFWSSSCSSGSHSFFCFGIVMAVGQPKSCCYIFKNVENRGPSIF